MQIIMMQISNGWTVTVRFPGKGDSTIAVPSFEAAIDEITALAIAAREQHEKETSSIMKGVHIPVPKNGP